MASQLGVEAAAVAMKVDEESFIAPKTVLIVDDSKVDRMISDRILTRLGLTTVLVENGKEAVDVHLSGKKFDFIVIDNEMPVMTGIEAVGKMRAMGVVTKIIGISSEEVYEQEFRDAGVDEFIIKPMSMGKLTTVLNSI